MAGHQAAATGCRSPTSVRRVLRGLDARLDVLATQRTSSRAACYERRCKAKKLTLRCPTGAPSPRGWAPQRLQSETRSRWLLSRRRSSVCAPARCVGGCRTLWARLLMAHAAAPPMSPDPCPPLRSCQAEQQPPCRPLLRCLAALLSWPALCCQLRLPPRARPVADSNHI